MIRTLALALGLAACAVPMPFAGQDGQDGQDGAEGAKARPAPQVELSRKAAGLTDARACTAEGGVWGRGGLSPDPFCNLRYADAGLACTDADECGGRCIAEDASDVGLGGRAEGQCQTYTSQFGCYALVEEGRIGPTLCVD